ncbi:MAG TPA: 4Fe-4S binding protein [Candidatus Hydrogenedentes bacterium]|mgnify:FL=1|nr:4Fe-4S binding protein [Candidatus Hydrogenedentota bacterium]HOV75879.1 4Fe-4S binding protein [Candidatus Hydrogenedentota bacterium]HPC15084.1 4Fe-4S binding protein [Candidatus Hydrogenedentota bacterium]HRT19055.1 4Fe-4S binding protein [Candidatus Hydrogenedentota bacterium]HRT63984.1 4Fe-4S binding protein [Candidatus Hydrogenedentota bacterium]
MGTRECEHTSAMATPSFGEAGRTGDWRTQRPVVDNTKCIPAKNNRPGCFSCWMYCPEAVIKRTIPIEIDLEYCKGCGICAEECVSGAISMVPETGSDAPTTRE